MIDKLEQSIEDMGETITRLRAGHESIADRIDALTAERDEAVAVVRLILADPDSRPDPWWGPVDDLRRLREAAREFLAKAKP